MLGGIHDEWEKSDAVYVWGMFLWCLPFVLIERSFSRRPVIVSPRGMLAAAAVGQKAAKKRAFLAMVSALGLAETVIHATSIAEAEDVLHRWPRMRVVVVPNGVEVPEVMPERDPGATPFVLYLGRLHPYKRVERIIAAFAQAVRWERSDGRGQKDEGGRATEASLDPGGRPASGDAPDLREAWSLVVAGDGEAAYRRDLERVASEAGVGARVRFAGQVSGDEKSRLLAQAEGVVLGSLSENFGMSVAEALAHGTPCVVTKTAPWEGLDREGCGFWVDDSEEALAAGMRRLMALSPKERWAMGERGRAWMRREFSWGSVGRRMLALYEELVAERAVRPS